MIQTLFGGNITLYTELCEKAREEAFQLMLEHAATAGANAIIGMRYDANDVAPGVTEVLAYGTDVVLAPQPPPCTGWCATRESQRLHQRPPTSACTYCS